jgi:hypothetical protein
MIAQCMMMMATGAFFENPNSTKPQSQELSTPRQNEGIQAKSLFLHILDLSPLFTIL